MKKACITVRDAQIRELDQKGELPIVLLGQAKELGSRGSSEPSRSGGAAKAALARKAPKRDFRFAVLCARSLLACLVRLQSCFCAAQRSLYGALHFTTSGF